MHALIDIDKNKRRFEHEITSIRFIPGSNKNILINDKSRTKLHSINIASFTAVLITNSVFTTFQQCSEFASSNVETISAVTPSTVNTAELKITIFILIMYFNRYWNQFHVQPKAVQAHKSKA